ncbi:MAG: beta-N-acetylglucosaminidase domain-containing protein [Deltaproteobacteria bacterium]|nr:beta-N-acetylglucosaminidase domain-containing protein [Deltaproteobacteria bacterium]
MRGRRSLRRLGAWLAIGTSASAGAAPAAFAEPLDLSRFARVTATATRATSFGLWPRESDDAPATVRDGDPGTSWKVPGEGATLTLDFAPLATRAPRVARLVATWSVAPRGDVVVRGRDGCGGARVVEVAWPAASRELALDPPVAASCWTLAVPGRGEPALAELAVYAAPAGPAPTVANLRGDVASVAPGSVRLLWDLPGVEPHHVDLHYLRDRAEPLSEANRVARSRTARVAEITLPAPGFTTVAAVPVAEDGTRGAPVFAELPARAPATLAAASGVVEGFYGRPWSHDERREMVVRLGTSALGCYLYAPKSDPLHRAEWRVPYDEAALARFGELHELGRRVGVRFAMGISPGIDIAALDPADRAALVAKLAPFVARGFRDFGLLLDDIEDALGRPVDAALGAEHRDLANGLLAALTSAAGEPVRLWVVPTVYSTERQLRFADGPATSTRWGRWIPRPW